MITIPDGTEIAATYRVDARLGSGAFGTVYRVHHRFLGRMALKLMACESDADLVRLTQEGTAHARLSHPNITRVFDVNVTHVSGDRLLYIASEYMSGGDLDSYLDQVHRFPMNEWSTLANDLLGALQYAHEQPSSVLHRDLKPSNILIGGGASPIFKVSDFGVSAELQPSQRIAKAAGTIIFQPPECAFGPYIAESDIYGAATVLFRALTGIYPFPLVANDNDPSLQRLKQDPPPPSRFRLDCSNELDAVMLRALAPNPFDRYRTASDFRRAVKATGGFQH